MKQCKHFTVILLSAAASIYILAGIGLADVESRYIGTVPVAITSLLKSEPGSDECALGSIVADAARFATDADIAIVNSGDIINDLPQGEVYSDDVAAVFSADRQLAVTEITAPQLKQLLEHAVSAITLRPDTESIDREKSASSAFAQVSGFSFKYDASAEAGERVISVTLSDGSSVDLSDSGAVFTLAATGHMLSSGYGYPYAGGYADAGITLATALEAHIAERSDTFEDVQGGRITAIGARDNQIVGALPTPVLVLGVIVIIAFWVFMQRSREKQH